MATDTYATAAAAGFNRLADLYKTDDFALYFWFGGYALHTCLDYGVNAGNQPESVREILSLARTVFGRYGRQPNWWRDDFGWWGNAFLRALNNRESLGYDDQTFTEVLGDATYCWER